MLGRGRKVPWLACKTIAVVKVFWNLLVMCSDAKAPLARSVDKGRPKHVLVKGAKAKCKRTCKGKDLLLCKENGKKDILNRKRLDNLKEWTPLTSKVPKEQSRRCMTRGMIKGTKDLTYGQASKW